MRLRRALVAALAGLASTAGGADLPGPCGPIARPYEAIELPVAALRRLGGTAIDRLALLALRDDRLEPIPFQIDERRGRKIALADGPEPLADDRPGVLDADDLVVFMACDANARLPAGPLADRLPQAGAIASWREIELRDPLTGALAYAYLVAAAHPPQSSRRYVEYTPGADIVATAAYRVGLVSALPTYLALVTRGMPGPNLLDGARLRAHATLIANLADFSLNERQGRHQLIAWKAGPVRVVRRSRHYVAVGFGVNLTAGVANTYFYARHVYGPGSMRLPFSPGILFRDIDAIGGADGRDLRDWRYQAPGVPPRGFAVDGHMDADESRFDASGDWFVLAHGEQAILFVTRLSENLSRAITMRLVYRDDATQPYPPEEVPGTVPLVGVEGRHVERLPGGRYRFALHILALPGFQAGDERAPIAAIDAPVVATVTPAGAP